MHFTDPTTAARALLFARSPSPVLYYDLHSYLVQDASETLPLGFLPILTNDQIFEKKFEGQKAPEFREFGEWIAELAENHKQSLKYQTV